MMNDELMIQTYH